MNGFFGLRLWGLLGVMAGAGCPGPLPGVSVTRDGNQYVIAIRECRSMPGAMPVWDIRVSLIRDAVSANMPAVADESLCAIWFDFDAKTRESPTLERWKYGVAPPGFVMRQCQPLAPGNTYKIDIGSRPRGVIGHFAIKADGSVQMIDGDCKK